MKKDFLKKLILPCLLFASHAVHAGGWSSGGGELLRDQINPWFLNNVSEVKYCIEIDEKNFGQTKEQVRPRILNAIEFWKMNFKDLEFFVRNEKGPILQIENLTFVEQDCAASTDLRFQFGVLSKEQKEKLPNFRDFIGLTIRTDYDTKILKGKGFIYIAPQSGDMKPVSPQLIENFWSKENESRLFPVLIHEIGHVFGIQHSAEITMMDEGFVEYIVTKQHYQSFPDYNYYEEFEKFDWKKTRLFKFSTEFGELLKFSMCMMSAPIQFPVEPEPVQPILPPNPNPVHPAGLISNQKQFISRLPFSKKPIVTSKQSAPFKNKNIPDRPIPNFNALLGIPDQGANCTRWGIENNKFQALYRAESASPWIVAGEMELEKPWFEANFGTRTIIQLWVPEGQTLIPNEPFYHDNSKALVASGYSTVVYKGNYKSVDGKQNHRFVITANPGYIKSIGGVVDGEVYYSLQWGF